MKKIFVLLLTSVLVLSSLTACGNENVSNKLYVYNWGEYIDPVVLEMFEEETGIQVIYDEFETNESMYSKISAGAALYDLVCPSDYMISKMITEDLLQPINWENIPNRIHIGEDYWEMSKGFDEGGQYALPYCWGTVGILYNTTMVSEPIDEWADLWDPKYTDEVLMQDSVRDAFMVALKKAGNSCNSLTVEQLELAKQELITQKPIVQAYVVDQVRDKMIGGEAAIGVIYSGEAIYTQRENPDLEYVIPKEGSNVWIDSWVIPKNAHNVENAEKFLDFLCRPNIAFLNFDYITYSTPNTAARELIEDEEIRNSQIAFPNLADYDLEVYKYLGEEVERTYNNFWKQVKAY